MIANAKKTMNPYLPFMDNIYIYISLYICNYVHIYSCHDQGRKAPFHHPQSKTQAAAPCIEVDFTSARSSSPGLASESWSTCQEILTDRDWGYGGKPW